MGRTKVFVGNLSFKTTDRDLATEFEAAGGKVVTASIISRGSRSLGYGFVEMENEEDAKKSVELLNKKLIEGREINVEIARPREEKPAQEQAAAPAASNGAPAAAGAEGAQRGGAVRGRRPFRGGRRFRRGGARNTSTGAPNGAEGAAQGSPAQGGAQSGAQSAPAQGSPAQGGAQGAPQRRPRAPRPPRNDAERAPRNPSTDTLFVANLPFSVDDAGLSKIFEGLNVKAAHVVRKHNERSKGFGFVEFHNPEDQQKALGSVDKKQIDGRELSVKPALTEVARTGGAAAAAAAASASPATPAPAPAAGAEQH